MPFLHIRSGQTLAAPSRAALAQALTDAIVNLLGKRREVTAVQIDSVPADGWFIAGSALPDTGLTPVHAELFITRGTNSEAEKAALLAELHDLLEQHYGPLPEASYSLIHELPATDWGYAGLSQAARQQARSLRV